jgi:hypothetical protein
MPIPDIERVPGQNVVMYLDRWTAIFENQRDPRIAGNLRSLVRTSSGGWIDSGRLRRHWIRRPSVISIRSRALRGRRIVVA